MLKLKRTTTIFIISLVAILISSSPGNIPIARAANSFVVNNNFDDADAHDKNPNDCVCADKYNVCTLRAAIEEANACLGDDTITFS